MVYEKAELNSSVFFVPASTITSSIVQEAGTS